MMNRSTRLVTQLNSPESVRFFTTKTFLLYRPQNTLAIPPIRQFSTPKNPRITSSAIENPNPNTESVSESIATVVSGSGEGEGSKKRKVLPDVLSRNVVFLTCESTAEGGTCDVYLVGTIHGYQESCREVQAVISFLKPQVVFLELCASREAVLSPQNFKVPTMGEMVEMWKKKHNIFGIPYSWYLAKAANLRDNEFRVAYEEATKYGGKVILGDRPLQITIRRTWAEMSLWQKIILPFFLLFTLLFQVFYSTSPEDHNKMLKKMDNVYKRGLLIKEIRKEFPTMMEALVDERDKYMSATLLEVASKQSSVVAVVGKGHLPGMKKYWKQPVKVKDLLEIPSKKTVVSAVKVLTTLGVAVAGVCIISRIYLDWKK